MSAGECTVLIGSALLGLFLLLAVASWSRAGGSRLRSRVAYGGKAVHHALREAAVTRRTKAEARLDFVHAVGDQQALERELRRALEDPMRASLGRRIREAELRQHARELARQLPGRWGEARGHVPRLRRDLPEETWPLACDLEKFANEWNARTWLHDERHGPLSAEQLASEPSMSPREFVDWHVDLWASALRRQAALGCADVVFIPLFACGFAAYALHEWAGLDVWLAIVLALVLVVPFMTLWTLARRRGYLTWGD